MADVPIYEHEDLQLEAERLRAELTALRTAGDRLANEVDSFVADSTDTDHMEAIWDASEAWRTARKDTP